MDTDEAIKLLKGGPEGVAKWNSYWGEHWIDGGRFDLGNADFSGANLKGANLRHTYLGAASLKTTILTSANLIGTTLCGADLSLADLRGANLVRADLTDATLRRTELAGANLLRADLTRASLFFASVRYAALAGAKLTNVTVGNTVFASDLSSVKGLESVDHIAPSVVSINDTLLKFKDDLPEKFLRGCGLADEDIAYYRSRIDSPNRVSCFISYSHKDEEFASRLHNDFQAAGIRCWKWDHDARTGKTLWGEIDQAIRINDKLVFIASEASLKSPAVNREIERSIQQEDERESRKAGGKYDGDVNVLFPVRLDDYLFDGWEHERKADVVKKVVADARGWDSDPDVYAKVRDRLIRDLKSGDSA